MRTTSNQQNSDPPAMAPGDIYFILFRHKWKIIVLSLVGVVAAVIYWWYCPPPFESEAKLFVRYVLDNHSVAADAKNAQTTSPDAMGLNIMNSEIEILTSFDLAEQAAKDIGPDKILAKYGGGNDPVIAAGMVRKNLIVASPKDDSVIHLVYKNADPAIVQAVLSEIINNYLDKHLQVHESSLSDDYLTQETAQLRSQIDETETELQAAKNAAGIISIPEAEKSYTDQIARIREQLFEAQAYLSAQSGGANPESLGQTNGAAASEVLNTPQEREDEYQQVCARLEFLQKRERQYFTQYGYTDQNRLVQETRTEIASSQTLKRDLEERYPDLAGTYIPSPGKDDAAATGADAYSENLQPSSLQAIVPALKRELAEVEAEASKVSDAESKITDLQRKKAMLEDNYQNFAASLEQSRIDETLGPGRVSNISTVEAPTPPFKDISKLIKAMVLIIGGGIFAGLAWAFFIEFYLDTSVRHSKEIEARLKLPLLISIPDISHNGHKRLVQAAGRRQLQYHNGDGFEGGGKPGILSWEPASCLNPFYDALRDRLVNYFVHAGASSQSKLVAVTGTEKGCGVSGIAAGVAASLSETGERVLLVDMKSECGVAQHFFLGRPCCGLYEALLEETRNNALVQDNLYVVAAESPDERSQRNLPKLFTSLLPRLKASDYSYIIFDMPSVSQTSITPRLAGFMDMVMLIIQSERTGRAAAQEAVALLAQSRAKVGIVLNKTRNYIPDRLHREALADF